MRAFHFATVAPIVLAMAGGGLADDKTHDEKTGLKVGIKAPTFTLKDQNGKEHTLEEFLKKGKVALVFYRSASW
jgi:cytochrome oxidase Cu insertion factor (SCO1/SenC/PrrC family)